MSEISKTYCGSWHEDPETGKSVRYRVDEKGNELLDILDPERKTWLSVSIAVLEYVNEDMFNHEEEKRNRRIAAVNEGRIDVC